MAVMTMIESADSKISWECSACRKAIKDKESFEAKTKKCPNCGEPVTEFISLYDENGDYI